MVCQVQQGHHRCSHLQPKQASRQQGTCIQELFNGQARDAAQHLVLSLLPKVSKVLLIPRDVTFLHANTEAQSAQGAALVQEGWTALSHASMSHAAPCSERQGLGDLVSQEQCLLSMLQPVNAEERVLSQHDCTVISGCLINDCLSLCYTWLISKSVACIRTKPPGLQLHTNKPSHATYRFGTLQQMQIFGREVYQGAHDFVL
jgi:hypothetical protein